MMASVERTLKSVIQRTKNLWKEIPVYSCTYLCMCIVRDY
jgi:hypothetical protein